MANALPEDGKVMQICFVTGDIETAIGWFAGLSGMPAPKVQSIAAGTEPNAVYRGRPATVSCRLAFFKLGNIDVEFVEPGPEPSAWREVLEAQGPGFHHIAFTTRNMTERSRWLEDRGALPIQTGEYSSRTGRYAYHAVPALGTMFELLESYADREPQ
jgi:hypothetical protein